MDSLLLDTLKEGLPTLTRAWGSFLYEAGYYCLETQGHKSGIKLIVKGKEKEVYSIFWKGQITPKIQYSWRDQEEAVVYGASCIAILLAIKKTSYSTVERSIKGTGFDYWLGDMNNIGALPFQRKARLEISGIKKGNDNLVNRRVNIKLQQTNRSDKTGFPAYIIVVEFSTPMSIFKEK